MLERSRLIWGHCFARGELIWVAVIIEFFLSPSTDRILGWNSLLWCFLRLIFIQELVFIRKVEGWKSRERGILPSVPSVDLIEVNMVSLLCQSSVIVLRISQGRAVGKPQLFKSRILDDTSQLYFMGVVQLYILLEISPCLREGFSPL